MDVAVYLTNLPQAALDALYADPWTCQAVFRSLPSLAKQWVLRLTFSTTSVAESCLLEQWTAPSFRSQGRAALHRLVSLRILREHGSRDPLPNEGSIVNVEDVNDADIQYDFNHYFQDNFQRVLTERGNPPWQERRRTDDESEEMEFNKDLVSQREQLDRFTTSCWEKIQLYIMGSSEIQPPSDRIVSLLVRGGIMTVDEDDMSVRIADQGFPFLLQDPRTQVWRVLFIYLEMLQEEKANVQEILAFLFRLSFLVVGEGYLMQDLHNSQPALLRDLQELGLLYRSNIDSPWVYPTPLAIGLSSTEALQSENEGWLIVGTDYRIYAYTSSPVRVLQISLFCSIEYQLPNMVMGILMRENVRQAIMCGITANQILQFLETNAHPQMRKNTPVIAESIADQLRLWEAEDKRVSFEYGYFYDDFPSETAFLKAERYSRSIGALLYSNPRAKSLFLTESGHKQLRLFIKRELAPTAK